jgi:hypothetical protein
MDHLLRMQLAHEVAQTREHARGLSIKRYARRKSGQGSHAAISGYLSAEAVFRSANSPQKFLRADLPATGLSRLFR